MKVKRKTPSSAVQFTGENAQEILKKYHEAACCLQLKDGELCNYDGGVYGISDGDWLVFEETSYEPEYRASIFDEEDFGALFEIVE